MKVTLAKSAGAVVFHRRKEKCFYLLLRHTEPIFRHSWGFPKGTMEPGETETETALREVQEETDLHVKVVPGFRETITYAFRDRGYLIKKTVVYFLGEAKSGRAKVSHEHEALEWLPYEKAVRRLTFENARNVLQKANKFLNNPEQRRLTEFEQKVYQTTKKIPRGRVSTYAAIARAIGKPRAVRAVGNALNKNPFKDVSCHRVVRSDGLVGGYARGTNAKIKRLRQEGVEIKDKKVGAEYFVG